MKKSVICLLIFSVSFQIAACNINCFLDRKFPFKSKLVTDIRQYGGSLTQLCHPLEEYFEAIGDVAEECNMKRIDVSELLAFIKDICTKEEELSNRYVYQLECFKSHWMSAVECIRRKNVHAFEKETSQFNLTRFESSKKDQEKACTISESVYECLNDEMGKPCGDEGFFLIKKLTTSLSSYTKGVCLELYGASTVNSVSWNVLFAILVATLLTSQRY